ncbi:hypothetical protein [Cerasicoccus fimbriatus]|uniref:hypothetical protein n=1 Tax=Cerasicoccus fimbriatus TaxID=3014554 RepID=UPI0022B2CAA5|nr:hypothetical protein [Cerasicoccus sp. TK19100]
MEPATIRRYIQARKEIDQSAKKICAITQTLAHLEQSSDDQSAICPNSLGAIHLLLSLYAIDILSVLENFAPIKEAEREIEKLD